MSLRGFGVGSHRDGVDSRRLPEFVEQGFTILPRQPQGADVGDAGPGKDSGQGRGVSCPVSPRWGLERG
jgi:hypothetical protein